MPQLVSAEEIAQQKWVLRNLVWNNLECACSRVVPAASSHMEILPMDFSCQNNGYTRMCTFVGCSTPVGLPPTGTTYSTLGAACAPWLAMIASMTCGRLATSDSFWFCLL